jgi:hypothetical protein
MGNVQSALDVLKMANERGEVGYAARSEFARANEPDEWRYVDLALSKGWICYLGDASVGGVDTPHRVRTIYLVTDKGRDALDAEARSTRPPCLPPDPALK